jgi:hypothetical protein
MKKIVLAIALILLTTLTHAVEINSAFACTDVNKNSMAQSVDDWSMYKDLCVCNVVSLTHEVVTGQGYISQLRLA